MKRHIDAALTILRRPTVEEITGDPRSTLYARIHEGLFPKPIKIGPRSVGWVASEVEAVNAARISGCSDANIRELVKTLERSRRSLGRHLARNERPIATFKSADSI